MMLIYESAYKKTSSPLHSETLNFTVLKCVVKCSFLCLPVDVIEFPLCVCIHTQASVSLCVCARCVGGRHGVCV